MQLLFLCFLSIYHMLCYTLLVMNCFMFSGSGWPIHVALCEWSLPSSSVLGWMSADKGPLLMTSQGIKAPNCSPGGQQESSKWPISTYRA